MKILLYVESMLEIWDHFRDITHKLTFFCNIKDKHASFFYTVDVNFQASVCVQESTGIGYLSVRIEFVSIGNT